MLESFLSLDLPRKFSMIMNELCFSQCWKLSLSRITFELADDSMVFQDPDLRVGGGDKKLARVGRAELRIGGERASRESAILAREREELGWRKKGT